VQYLLGQVLHLVDGRLAAQRQGDLQRPAVRQGLVLQPLHHQQYADGEQGRGGRRQPLLQPHGHADRGGHPERRRGGQAAHAGTLPQDRAATEEADAGDDRRGQRGRVAHHRVRAGQADDDRPEDDQHVGTQSRRLGGQLPFESDGRTEHDRQCDLGRHYQGREHAPTIAPRASRP
jgi:hypothetical protein